MPVYEFKNKETGEITTHVMKISELDEFKKNNSNLEVHITGAPGCSDPVRLGLVKPAEGFRDLLKQIKKNNIHSKFNTFK
jgi:hypothetical protein